MQPADAVANGPEASPVVAPMSATSAHRKPGSVHRQPPCRSGSAGDGSDHRASDWMRMKT